MTCFLSNVHGLNDTSLETLQFKVLQALTNSVLYMEEHYKLLNLDALTGLRIVQGKPILFSINNYPRKISISTEGAYLRYYYTGAMDFNEN